jgi:putative aldouronate transport system permease protein
MENTAKESAALNGRSSRESREDKRFDVIVAVIVVFLTILVLYPLYFVVIASFSDPNLVESGQVLFLPRGITLEGYRYILDDNRIWSGYLNTFLYTIFGTLLAVCITVPAAYALSRRDMIGRGVLMKFFVFTMYFGGGMIPTYLLIKQLHLIDTYLVLILLGSFSAYNLIICRTFFQSTIPLELQEAAEIDGCSIPRFFFSVVLPLSKAVIAIMVLYYAVGHWNDYFNALIYINRQELRPLQLVMRDILIQGQTIDPGSSVDPEQIVRLQQIGRSIKYGSIIVSSLPVLIFYPFVQKYFVKGVMIGSIKG